jgi:hypothetical protein
MGEVLTLQVGGCGTKIGCDFWHHVREEHFVNQIGESPLRSNEGYLQTDEVFRFFRQTKNGNFLLRAILADKDFSDLQSTFNSPMFHQFSTFKLCLSSKWCRRELG